MSEYVLSLSYGKDSLACLGAIEQLGWPLDRIVHVEVWATDTLQADPPEMVEFKDKADAIIKARFGLTVERLRADYTYEQKFYSVRGGQGRQSNSAYKGQIYGWPFQRGAWCNGHLKLHPLEKHLRGTVQYVGIAADEPGRFHVLSDTKLSPLVEAGWSEMQCRHWCEKNELLSPIYTTATRGGCWFCHNQSTEQLRQLRKNRPELWAIMLRWDADSPVKFKANGHTLHDYELRFSAEDAGTSPAGRFLWKSINEAKEDRR